MSELKSINKEYATVIGEAQRMTFVRVIRRYPGVTLAEVAELADKLGLTHLKISECFFETLPNSPEGYLEKFGKQKMLPAPKKETTKRKAKKHKAKKRNLNTEASQARYDVRILKLLKSDGDWWLTEAIRRKIGGNSLDMRTALNRLYNAGSVRYKGTGRGTRYKAK